MKGSVETVKVVFLAIITVATLAQLRLVYDYQADDRAERKNLRADAERAREVLLEFYKVGDRYTVARSEWIDKRKPSNLILHGSPEWKMLATEFKGTKTGMELAKQLKDLRSEYQVLTWRHPTWSFMFGATPNAKLILAEDD